MQYLLRRLAVVTLLVAAAGCATISAMKSGLGSSAIRISVGSCSPPERSWRVSLGWSSAR